MTTMNYESSKWSRDAIDDVVVDEVTLAKRRRRRRIIIAVLAVLALVVLAVFLLGGRGEKAVAPQAGQGQQLPAVTVIVPGRQDIAALISATGSLAARRDMPVGIPGEGGQVERVLVEPGQWVRAGQPLAIINRSVQSQQAAQLAAQIEVTRADLRLAQNQLDRAQRLVGRGFISQADLDQKRATRDAAAARVRVAEAQLGATRAQIGRLDVRAPTAGLVLSRSIEAGQVVGAGSGALFRIAEGGQMELLARLPQSDLARLSVGVPVTVTPVGASQSYQGIVWQISPIIDPLTRQGVVRILVPYNRDVRPGGFASAEIRAGSMNAPLLPESAVQSDARGNYVYVIDNQNKVARRDVRVGEVSDQGVAIASGLSGNERVVESAGAFLSPGQRVRPEARRAAR
ncbi:MAG: HlyD family secretion protein [Sphingomonadales bacterium]|jgi:RND family efflux transporter MFP subunit|nr:HlyD family secretion protein [Sphingomonadales bacterium]MEA3044486.1 HlyD family secretion protein [Sphingomonadales bacterium]MEA3045896.1 HlyD family secretion protein [Sphingomonadales bacterium]